MLQENEVDGKDQVPSGLLIFTFAPAAGNLRAGKEDTWFAESLSCIIK